MHKFKSILSFLSILAIANQSFANGSTSGSGNDDGWDESCPDCVCPQAILNCNCPIVDYDQIANAAIECPAVNCPDTDCPAFDYSQVPVTAGVDYGQIQAINAKALSDALEEGAAAYNGNTSSESRTIGAFWTSLGFTLSTALASAIILCNGNSKPDTLEEAKASNTFSQIGVKVLLVLQSFGTVAMGIVMATMATDK